MSNFKMFLKQIEAFEKKHKEVMEKLNEPMKKIKEQQNAYKKAILLSSDDIKGLFQLPESIKKLQEMHSPLKQLLQYTAFNQIMKKIPNLPEFPKFKNNNINSLTVLPLIPDNDNVKIKVDVIKDSDDIDVNVSEEDGKVIIKVKKSKD